MTETASNEAVAAVLSGMIAFDQGITNTLIDSHLDDAISWAHKFEKLYQRIEFAIESGNVIQAYRILESFGYDYDRVPEAVEHYESMKMGGTHEENPDQL